jgi:hypothetical protein
MQGITRPVLSYNQATGLLEVANGGYAREGDPFPGWDSRGIRISDRFKVYCRHDGAGGVATYWEPTSRVYRDPYGKHSVTLYKSIRFKYSTALLPQANSIGDDSTGVQNRAIADGTAFYLHWKDIEYNFIPEITHVMPSDLFPGVPLSHRSSYWPCQNQLGPIIGVTPILVGTYAPPRGFAVPVYIWRIQYAIGGFKNIQFPVFWRPKSTIKGFQMEMWAQKRSRQFGPWPTLGCNLRRGGGGYAVIKNGEWIYFRQETVLGMPLSTRNPLKRHDDFYIRFRNKKDGGLTPLSRLRVSMKYRQIWGYVWNLPILEG